MCAALAPGAGGKSHLVGAPPFSPRFKDSSNTGHQESSPDPSLCSTISVLGPLASPLGALLYSILRATRSYAHFTDKETEAGSRPHSSWRPRWNSNKVCFQGSKCVCGRVRSRRMFQKCSCWGHDSSGQRRSFWAAAVFLVDFLHVVSFTFHNGSTKQGIIFPFHR